MIEVMFFFFFSSRRRHTRFSRDWSSDVCSSDLDDHGDGLLDIAHGAYLSLVPTLRVGTQAATLRVASVMSVTERSASPQSRDAERPGLRSHAERGNEVRLRG